jgi:hypothetical protein
MRGHFGKLLSLHAALLLSCGACSVNAQYADERRVRQAQKLFVARDECLKRNAEAAAETSEELSIAAAAVAESCRAESAKFNEIVNVPREREITSSVYQQTLFRATGFVMKARGAPASYD